MQLFPRLLFLFSLLACSAVSELQCSKNSWPPDPAYKVKTYTISLDDNPFDRWRTVVSDHKDHIKELISYFKTFLSESFGITEHFFTVIEYYFSRFLLTMPSPYKEEMLGIAHALDLKESYVLITNIFYEIFTFCTSIVYCDENKSMYHARNLDFGALLGWDPSLRKWYVTEKLLPLTVAVNVYKNGTLLYTSMIFAGSVGTFTGLKPDKFSVSVNERFAFDSGWLGLLEWLLKTDREQKFVSFAVREALEQLPDYQGAVSFLSTARLLAPTYFIVSSSVPYEACVITRTRSRAIDIWKMNSSFPFLVQTNFDHWKELPFYDDRVTPSYDCYHELKNLNYTAVKMLYNILSTKPILNIETIHSSVMYIKNGSLTSFLRNVSSEIL